MVVPQISGSSLCHRAYRIAFEANPVYFKGSHRFDITCHQSYVDGVFHYIPSHFLSYGAFKVCECQLTADIPAYKIGIQMGTE